MDGVYLAHHGIKGMKWGVRRWQNNDGSLTPAGYDHYGVEKYKSDYEKAKNDLRKTKLYGGNTNKAHAEYNYRKKEYSDVKARSAFKSQKSIPKRQQTLIEKYKKEGYTQEEAEVAAYKRAKTEKILKGVLATAAVAAVAYGTYKYADYAFDKKLGTGTTLSRVSKELHEGGSRGVFDAFYAVNDKSSHDKARYGGLYALQMRRGDYGYVAPKVYEKKIGVDSAIKVASRKHAKEAFAKELAKGDNLTTVRNELRALGYGRYNNPAVLEELDKFSKTGKIGGHLYDAINKSLVARDLETTKMFYRSLKNAGYGAVKDVNDAKYSGFRTKLPLIIFDSSKVSVKQVNQLADSKIIKDANRVIKENAANANMKSIAPTAAYYSSMATLAFGLSSYASSASEQKAVLEYRREHPNSKLSRNEIIRNYYGQKNEV